MAHNVPCAAVNRLAVLVAAFQGNEDSHTAFIQRFDFVVDFFQRADKAEEEGSLVLAKIVSPCFRSSFRYSMSSGANILAAHRSA